MAPAALSTETPLAKPEAHTSRHTCTHKHIHTHTNTHTNTYTRTYAQMQAHIHTQTRNISMRTKINFADKGFIMKTLFLWSFFAKSFILTCCACLIDCLNSCRQAPV